jgi:hypothetical protein
MTEPPSGRVEGDEAAMLFLAAVVVGIAVNVAVKVAVGHGVLGSALAFFGSWVAFFPFARRLWAAGTPVWRYLTGALRTAVVAALRLLTE